MSSSTLNTCVIADDLRTVRYQLSHWMQERGFQCILANCGEAAIQAIHQGSCRLVVTDIDMPGSSGLNLLYRLRNDPDRSIASIPVIVTSSLQDSQIEPVVRELGGNLFLPKPIDKAQMMRAIDEVMSQRNVGSGTANRTRVIDPFQTSPRFRRIADEIKCLEE